MSAGYPNQIAPWPAPRRSRWSAMLDRAIVALQRLGFVVGQMHVLVLPGRQSGIPRSTPVSILDVDGERYIVACREDADWVLDARASGHGMLRRGRIDERVSLTEVPVTERAPILREIPRRMPGSVPAFTRRHGISADPEAFATLAPRCPVFRVARR